VLGLFALFGCLNAMGCSSSRAQECTKLITVLNKNAESVKAATSKINAADANAASFNEAAASMEAAADDIGTVPIKDDELTKIAGDYREMLRSGAKAVRDLGKARDDNDVPGIDKASGELATVDSTEPVIVERIKKYCSQ